MYYSEQDRIAEIWGFDEEVSVQTEEREFTFTEAIAFSSGVVLLVAAVVVTIDMMLIDGGVW